MVPPAPPPALWQEQLQLDGTGVERRGKARAGASEALKEKIPVAKKGGPEGSSSAGSQGWMESHPLGWWGSPRGLNWGLVGGSRSPVARLRGGTGRGLGAARALLPRLSAVAGAGPESVRGRGSRSALQLQGQVLQRAGHSRERGAAAAAGRPGHHGRHPPLQAGPGVRRLLHLPVQPERRGGQLTGGRRACRNSFAPLVAHPNRPLVQYNPATTRLCHPGLCPQAFVPTGLGGSSPTGCISPHPPRLIQHPQPRGARPRFPATLLGAARLFLFNSVWFFFLLPFILCGAQHPSGLCGRYLNH